MDEGVGRHRVAERWDSGEKAVFWDANEPQEDVPAGTADACRHDDIDLVRAETVLSEELTQEHGGSGEVGGEYL